MPPKPPGPSKPKTPFAPRKLLVAAVGVATINYVAACDGLLAGKTGGNETSGNLPSPYPYDAQVADEIPPTSGNLPAPVFDAAADADGGDADTDADAEVDGGADAEADADGI